MSLHYSVEVAEEPFPDARSCHVAVTWKDTILIWGGKSFNEDDGTFTDHKTDIYCHISGQWHRKDTIGDAPPGYREAAVEVINDSMLVLGKWPDDRLGLYSLNLKTWVWTYFTPEGHAPTDPCFLRSWVYKGNIYYWNSLNLGNGRLLCYNTSKNSWEWPVDKGAIPSKRLRSYVTISKDTVFVFSGNNFDLPYTDLHTLDMATLRWSKVHDNLSTGKVPNGIKRSATLTCISESKAVLFGSVFDGEHPNETITNDCWLLHLDKARKLMNKPHKCSSLKNGLGLFAQLGRRLTGRAMVTDIKATSPATIWTRLPNHFLRRNHAAVVEQVSQRLWVIGGEFESPTSSQVLKMSHNLVTLRDLAIDCAARSITQDDSRLLPHQLPQQLGKEVEEYRAKIGGVNVCNAEKGCIVCQQYAENDTQFDE